MDGTRRNILKMFGVAAIAATPPACEMVLASPLPMTEAPATPRTFDYAPPPPPEGFTYQWKRMFVTAEEPDFRHILEMVEAGWTPVPALRHPEKYPPNGSYWVEIGGLVLMEKPTKDLAPPRAYPMPWETASLKDYEIW